MRPSRLSTPLVLLALVACASEPRTQEVVPASDTDSATSRATVLRGPDRVFVTIKGVT